jgi:hypothetical protein
MQLGHHPFLLLYQVCTHSVHTIAFFIIILPISEISSVHRPYHGVSQEVIGVAAGAFAEIYPNAPRNAIGVLSASVRPCHVLTP